EERLRLALAAADVGTWDFHPVSGTLAWDERCKAVFGLPADAVVDFEAFLAAAHPDDRAAVKAEIAEALDPEGTGEFGCEYRVVWPDGTVRWALARGRAFFEGEGAERHAARFVGTILDVTERREAEEERERLLAELELERGRLEVLAVDRARLYEDALAASLAKTGFLATMSHELRTPLNAMIGFAELLLLGIPSPLPDGARSHVERIDRASRHLLSIIEEILTFSRIDAGRETVAAEPVELGELVGEVCAMAEPLAAEKRLRFAPPVLPAPVRLVTDPRKLRQILINLLGNAVKFTEAGEVELAVVADGGTVELRVRDTGIGIAPEDVERIFEPFLQVDQGTTRSVGGTGLGLAVSRELARMIGGEIGVESSPGRGSTFTVRLPAAPGEPA
ncbi:MAG TPA: ATP-binding protein, partial [Longimicrobiaceae bacterium]